MAKCSQPFGCPTGAGSSSSSSGKALLQKTHVPLASLAGGGRDEPGRPGQLGQALEDKTAAGMRMELGAFPPPSLKALLQEMVGLKHALAG